MSRNPPPDALASGAIVGSTAPRRRRLAVALEAFASGGSVGASEAFASGGSAGSTTRRRRRLAVAPEAFASGEIVGVGADDTKTCSGVGVGADDANTTPIAPAHIHEQFHINTSENTLTPRHRSIWAKMAASREFKI